MRIAKTVLLVVLGVLVLALAGCGDSQDNSTDNNPAQSEVNNTADQAAKDKSASSGGLALAAAPDGTLKFDKTSLDGTAGDISIKFTNDSSTPHNVTVVDSSKKELGATDDITQSDATLDLKNVKAGEYTFYCSVPGHEQAGMKGTLTVK